MRWPFSIASWTESSLIKVSYLTWTKQLETYIYVHLVPLQGDLNARAKVIILGELYGRQMIILITLEIDPIRYQHVLYGLNEILYIQFQMKCYTDINLSSKTFLKWFP